MTISSAASESSESSKPSVTVPNLCSPVLGLEGENYVDFLLGNLADDQVKMMRTSIQPSTYGVTYRGQDFQFRTKPGYTLSSTPF
jgi:hypothetical protein